MPKHNLSHLYLEGKYLRALQVLLKEHVSDAEIWAYGSRVTGQAHSGSDLDLVLRHATDLTKEVPNWLNLKRALQESTIPILIDLHLWWQLPKAFQENIKQDYVVIQ